MDNLFISGTNNTPLINFDCESGICEICGESYPISSEFWSPVLNWVKNYLNKGGQDLTLNFKINCCNVSSTKAIFQILELLEKNNKNGKKLTANWFYPENDQITKSQWEEFIEGFTFKSNIISYRSDNDILNIL